jgi:hypothetical protein
MGPEIQVEISRILIFNNFLAIPNGAAVGGDPCSRAGPKQAFLNKCHFFGPESFPNRSRMVQQEVAIDVFVSIKDAALGRDPTLFSRLIDWPKTSITTSWTPFGIDSGTIRESTNRAKNLHHDLLMHFSQQKTSIATSCCTIRDRFGTDSGRLLKFSHFRSRLRADWPPKLGHFSKKFGLAWIRFRKQILGSFFSGFSLFIFPNFILRN